MSGVLVVDDEEAIAGMVALRLRHAGFEVRIALDMPAAQQMVEAELPDIVLLDWMLPSGSGLMLARLWRREFRTRELPVIMLTARADEADKVAGLDAGVDDYLTKPFSPIELLARIRAVLRRRGLQGGPQALEFAGLRLEAATRRAVCTEGGESRDLRLGPMELRLLQHLMRQPHQVHEPRRLAAEIWGDAVFVDERTVLAHVERLARTLADAAAGARVEGSAVAGYRLTRTGSAAPADAG